MEDIWTNVNRKNVFQLSVVAIMLDLNGVWKQLKFSRNEISYQVYHPSQGTSANKRQNDKAKDFV